MRKVYVLSLFMLVLAGGAFAQRTIDWAVDEIVEPTQLNSTESGTLFTINATLKIISGDSAFVGDTIGYQMVLRDMGDNVLIAVPNGTIAARTLTKKMGVGDTVQLKFNIPTTLIVNESANVKFQIYSILVNRGANAINSEFGTATNDNNTNTKNIVWWNKQGWGVSVNDVDGLQGVEIFPNPAQNEVKVNWNLSNVDQSSTIRIMDLNGRIVTEVNGTIGAFEKSLDISALEAGLYVVEVSSGDLKTTQKLQVLK